MPTKQLPPNPDPEHLKRQARRLLNRCAAGDPQACQRLREFHPRFAGATDQAISEARLTWSDGLFAIAREYGFASWPRLKARISSSEGTPVSLRDRIDDPVLRQAVDALDDGDLEGLRGLLDAHPDLTVRRAMFEGENYFRTPGLLAFIAENPVRNDCLPPNIVEIARLILDAGATADRGDVDETLGLVASGRVARESGMQTMLIELLVSRGADPGGALNAALTHGEFAAADALLRSGARETLAAAAALGRIDAAERLLPGSSAAERHIALALAAQHGQADILGLLLASGEDPNRYNPPGAHSHSTPLHQAAWSGHEAAVRTLLDHGVRTDIKDALWDGRAIDWARHAGCGAIADLLAGRG
jgi:hypothetical protein